jgi:hypothetical protein
MPFHMYLSGCLIDLTYTVDTLKLSIHVLWRHIWIIVCHYLQALFLKQLFDMCLVLISQTPPSTIRKATNSASCWRNLLPLCNQNIQYCVHKSIPFSSLLSETGAGVHTSKHLNTFHSWKMATNIYWVTVSCRKIGTVKAILNFMHKWIFCPYFSTFMCWIWVKLGLADLHIMVLNIWSFIKMTAVMAIHISWVQMKLHLHV